MIYSRACELGIQAILYLALQPAGKLSVVRGMAADLEVPAPYLAKIVQHLRRKGLVRSFKGKRGGWRLSRPAKAIKLFDVVQAIDGVATFQRCVLGIRECSPDNWCPVHEHWVGIKNQILDMLEKQTIQQLALEARRKRLRLSRRRSAHRRSRAIWTVKKSNWPH